jgi:Cof subfamily protein (haloacid dehalogenase superfamily)
MTPAMEETAERIGIDCCIVSYNGAAVSGRRSQGRQRLVHQPLDAAIARELFSYAQAKKYQVNYYLDDVIVSEDAEHLLPWAELYRARTGSPFKFVPSLKEYTHRAPTKLLYVTAPETRPLIEEEIRPVIGQRATIIRTDPEYLEFLDPRVDKGWGVVKLAGILGIPMHAVMAVGDGENDISMLSAAGWGVAVKNALPPCAKAATVMTDGTNDEDAVGEAVERWVLS